jgi:hypothetical protein
MAIYRKRTNGRKVWWVRVNYRGLNASRVGIPRNGPPE